MKINEDDLYNMVLHAPIGICVLDATTLITEIVNDKFLEIAGKPYQAVYDKYYWDSFPETKLYYENALNEVVKCGNAYYANEVELMLIRNGQEEWVFVTFVYNPVKNKEDQVTKVAIWVLENTQQVKSRQAINGLNDQLSAANEELSASIEELAATNEELQLSNQAVTKLNTELLVSTQQVQQINDSLSESEARFRNMAEGSGILIGVGNAAGNVVYLNQAWSKLTGKTIQELLDFGWSNLIHPEDREEYLNLYMNSVRDRVPYSGEYRILTISGEYSWLLASASPRFAPDGSFEGFIGSFVDITERKQDEQRKNDFISMVSHELKTPLTSTLGYIQVSQKKALMNGDGTIAGMMERSVKQLGKMTRMINGFLNVSRLESGKIHIDLQRFDLALLVRETEEESIVAITTHQVIFAPVKETWVEADRDKIGQVINNLLSNAVKYSPLNSTIQVACSMVNGHARVSVQDQGSGINKEDLPRLCERYYRVKESDNKHIAGFGIGLYLCSEIIKRHDGEIWAESELGHGSIFWFTLPINI